MPFATLLVGIALSGALGQVTPPDCHALSFRNKAYFGGTGVIFAQPPNPEFLPLPKQYLALTLAEATRADSFLLAGLPTQPSRSFARNRLELYQFDRQYWGFIGSDGSRQVLVHLIRRGPAKRFMKHYDHALRCDVVLIFCEACKVDIRNYVVSLDTRQVRAY
ncbi:hypothetical protein LJY25_09605 [Hymenobacter sp. BT175]|uniref:hypothetical protein n=1 Tax=Hymenobacter translucens TaxID=2886507 RepID=UPI001D0EFE63|nr:hypothetical protein [Hymenobacter translucens]MCC2546696.1 hypothetical protein [Hymenobacter translucens]